MKNYFLTSESVTEGHPDKVCDLISDSILDELLKQDPESRVAVETLVTRGTVHIAGEVTTKANINFQEVARKTLKEIGYTDPKFGIDSEDAGVWLSIQKQSLQISQGVSESENKEPGAGDQGMMYGFACTETEELMPMPIIYSHKLTKRMAEVRKKCIIPHLGPDGKSQVTIEYEDDKPKRIDTIVIAQQHTEEISEEELMERIMNEVITPICPDLIDSKTKIYINATGKFIIGGPEGDTGLTGRKIIVDSYGGIGRHGGGAFSGKDPSKVDRSGAYMARYVAKNIVAAGLAEKCEVQISYAIGLSRPTSINVECFQTNKIPEEKIAEIVSRVFDLRPKSIIEKLDLKKPIYKKTASYGHFGRDEKEFTWELTDLAEKLREESQK
jgi:S-adenosylmethionine synthetase